MNPGDTIWSHSRRQACRLVSLEHLWDSQQAMVWFPGQETLVRLSLDDLAPEPPTPYGAAAEIASPCPAARAGTHFDFRHRGN